MKKISVIIPVYNVQKYIKECLESIVNQTIRDDIEAIIVNDGSSDQSQEIIDEYVKKYPYLFKSYIKENGGLGDARNYGLKYATGEYITFVDGDDFVKKETYEKVYNEAKHNDLDIVMFDISMYYKNGRIQILKAENNNIKENENLNNLFVISNPSACNKIFKRELWENYQFPKRLWYEDLYTIPILVKKVQKVGWIKEPFYMYRQRENSIMQTKPRYTDKLKDIFEVINKINKELKCTKYYSEVEFLNIEHLMHGSSLRFINYDEGKKEIKNISKKMKENFPNWRNNKYYKMQNVKYKIMCNLVCLRQIWILEKILKK
ncbi:MAG: glycosyltransferase family 2 protein [Clostridia bacterium]|nr:glycosyltransferase family 2 protein [Clostridia bacterium]